MAPLQGPSFFVKNFFTLTATASLLTLYTDDRLHIKYVKVCETPKHVGLRAEKVTISIAPPNPMEQFYGIVPWGKGFL